MTKWAQDAETPSAKAAKKLVESGKPGPGGRKARVMRPEDVAKKIQVSALLNVLHQVALEDKKITKERLKAIEILLRKAIPDLKAVELSGDDNRPIAIEIITNVKRTLDQD